MWVSATFCAPRRVFRPFEGGRGLKLSGRCGRLPFGALNHPRPRVAVYDDFYNGDRNLHGAVQVDRKGLRRCSSENGSWIIVPYVDRYVERVRRLLIVNREGTINS